MRLKHRVHAALATLACVGGLVGCGGGGSDAGPVEKHEAPAGADSQGGTSPPAIAVDIGGLWQVITSKGTGMTMHSAADGAVWAWYGGGGSTPNGWFAKANTTIAGGNLSGAAVAVDFATGSIDRRASLSAEVTTRQKISGQMTGSRATTFQGSYDAAYAQPASLDKAAGPYAGDLTLFNFAAHQGRGESMKLRVDASGSIDGSSPAGCSVSGTLLPRQAGGVYDVTLKTAACPVGNEGLSGLSMSGIVRLDDSSKMSTWIGLSAANDAAFMFVAQKVN